MKPKLLITGSTGFVGRHIIPNLINNNFAILEVTRDLFKSASLFQETTVKLFVDDIDFRKKIIDFKPDIVIHLAAYISSSDDIEDVEKLINANIIFLSKILDVVSKVGIKLFVNTGTFAEYFKGDNTFQPAYFYSATKIASRYIVDYYSTVYNFKQTTVVPYTIYGGQDSNKKIIDIIYESIKCKTKLDLSPGNQVLDFIHIIDVVEFYLYLINNEANLPDKSNIMLGTGVGHTLKEVAKIIEKITNQKTNINWGGKDYRKSDVMYAVASIVSQKQFFEWKPKINFIDGLSNYILSS